MSAERPVFDFDIERATKSRRWLSANGNLIVVSSEAQLPYCYHVLSRFETYTLERSPNPEEFEHFKSVIVIENVTPNNGEDLRVRSLWLGNGPWSKLGVVFPDLQPRLRHFETLQGILYPNTVNLDTDLTVSDPHTLESWLQAVAPQKVWCLTRLLSPRKKAHTLEQIILPDTGTHRLGIWGLGDIGTNVAVNLRRLDIAQSGINALFVGGSRNPAKIDAVVEELNQINLEDVHQPRVQGVKPGEEEKYFQECDVILILVAASIPSLEIGQDVDVRAVQYEDNIRLLKQFIAQAPSDYDGQILVGSDPVEQLTMNLYLAMREREMDVNTHQLAGFGGMINRSRAKRVADEQKLEHFMEEGRTFGPHGRMVLAFPTHNPTYYNAREAEALSEETGRLNYEVRVKGAKPYLGPAALITEGLIKMSRGGVLYASPFLPANKSSRNGAFFGTRVEAQPFPGTLTPRVDQPFLKQIMAVLEGDHRYVEITSFLPETMQFNPFDFTRSHQDHPAFHPYVMERWEDEATRG